MNESIYIIIHTLCLYSSFFQFSTQGGKIKCHIYRCFFFLFKFLLYSRTLGEVATRDMALVLMLNAYHMAEKF